MQSAVEAAWAAWDPAQAKPEEEQAPNLIEAARLKQSTAYHGRAGSNHSGSYTGSSNKSPVPYYPARNPADTTSVMQAPPRPPSTTSTALKRTTPSHPMSSGKESFPPSPKSQSRQAWTNRQTRLASPPISNSCNAALEASMANSNSNGWEIPTASVDTASGWETSTAVQQDTGRPAKNTAATTVIASPIVDPASDITKTIALPPSFDKSDPSTALLSRLVCRLENDPRYEDRVVLKLKTPGAGDWHILMDGPAADVQGIEKEIRAWLEQNCSPVQDKQENAADILQKLQGDPPCTSSIRTNGFSNHEHHPHFPPVSPPISAQQAANPVPALLRLSTSSSVHGNGRLPVTEPSLIPPQANVRVARSTAPLQDQRFPSVNVSTSQQVHHEGRPPSISLDGIGGLHPPTTHKNRSPGYVSIALAPKMANRFTPLLRDFSRIFGLKEAWIEKCYLRMRSHSRNNDKPVEVARRSLAILARCFCPDYETDCPNFLLSREDTGIWNALRGSRKSQPIPNDRSLDFARLIKAQIESIGHAADSTRILQAQQSEGRQLDEDQRILSTPDRPSVESATLQSHAYSPLTAHPYVLSVKVLYGIMSRIFHRPYDSQALERHFNLLGVDSVSYGKEGECLLVFTDRSESRIEFVRNVMAVLLRITEWNDEPPSKNMRLGPIEHSVRNGIMRQKDRLRGIHVSGRLEMLVRKLKEAYEHGGWQEEVLELQNREQQRIPSGFHDSGSWSQASEVKQDEANSAKADSKDSSEIPRKEHSAHSSSSQPDTASSGSKEASFGCDTGKSKEIATCIKTQENMDHQDQQQQRFLQPEQSYAYAEEANVAHLGNEAVIEKTVKPEATRESADGGQSSKRFKVTKVGLAPIMALRDEVPLEEITDEDDHLTLLDSNPANVQVAYDSLRVLTLLPGNIVNGEDLSALPSYLQQILLQHVDSKIWQRRSVATKVAVVVAAIRMAYEVQSHREGIEQNEATRNTPHHLHDRFTPAVDLEVVEDIVNRTSSAAPHLDSPIEQVDSPAAQVDILARDEAVTDLGAQSVSQAVHLGTASIEQPSPDAQGDSHGRSLAPLSPYLPPEYADNARSPTSEELRFYSGLRTQQNSISWKVPSHPQRGRLVGRQGKNMNLIRSVSGVIAVSFIPAPSNLGVREIYILTSQNQVASVKERQNLSIALKLFNIVCKFHDIRDLRVSSYHYNRVGLPDESRLTSQDLELCDKHAKVSQVVQGDIVAAWDNQLHELLLEVAEVYRHKFAETDIGSDVEPVEYMFLPSVDTSDPEYLTKAGYMALAEEAHEWQDLDELWNTGREEVRLRLRGSNEKALLRLADAMLNLGLQVPLSSSVDIGPSASLVGWDEATDGIEGKPEKLTPPWASLDDAPAGSHQRVETWAARLSTLAAPVNVGFPLEDLLLQRSTSPAAPLRDSPPAESDAVIYKKAHDEYHRYRVHLPSAATYLSQLVGPNGDFLTKLSIRTRTQLDLISDRDSKGPIYNVLIYGQSQNADVALKYLVQQTRALLPRWRFSDHRVNETIGKWTEEARVSQAYKLGKTFGKESNWIEEGTGLPIYIVHVPEEALGNVRLSIKSGDFAKIHVEIAESQDLPGKLDLYGTQPNCEKAVLRLREIARSHDPDWMPGGDANLIVERQDLEERANAVLHDSGREARLASPTVNGARDASVEWTSLQESPRSRKESSRSFEAPATGWSTFIAPGWDPQGPNVAQIQFPKITKQIRSSTFHARKDGSVSSKDYFSQTGREHMTTRSWHVPSTLLQQSAAPKIRLQ